MSEVEQSPAMAAALRVLSGIGGAIILFTSALFTLGASLGAPVGIFVARRRARRRDRPLTRGASWFAAVVGSIIAAGLVFLLVGAFMPTDAVQQIEKGIAEGQAARDTARAPTWMTKAFPPTARSDSATMQLMNTPGFVRVTVVVALLFACVFLGAIAGSMGWLGSVLLGYALWGYRP